MSGRISDYVVQKWLRGEAVPEIANPWMALHHENPDVSGAYASEIFGSGYSRVQVRYSPPQSRVSWNTDTITWRGLPFAKVTYVVGWDVNVNGNMLFSVPLDVPIRILAGKQISIPAYTVAISFD